jgi:arylsulfatase A-like enzyme
MCSQTISLVDLLATVAAISGLTLPPPDQGAEDSHNVLPALLGKTADRPLRESMITHSAEGNFALRRGNWKYIEGIPAVPLDRVPAMRRQEMAPQLYDLRQDPGESHNLLPRRPEVAAELKELLNTSRAAGHTRKV